MLPRVSLITTVYNAEGHLAEALQSVRSQSFQEWELVFWDDGSSDGSLAIGQEHAAADPRIRVFSSPHVGRNAALRLAHEQARGEYLGWLDADDRLDAEGLAKTVAVLDADPALGAVYSDHLEIDECGAIRRLGQRSLVPYSPRRLLTDFVSFHFRLMRRETFARAGGIDTSFPAAIDYDLCLRIAEISGLRRLAEPLYYYRVHDRQMSERQRTAQTRSAQRAVEIALRRRGLHARHRLDVRDGRFRLQQRDPDERRAVAYTAGAHAADYAELAYSAAFELGVDAYAIPHRLASTLRLALGGARPRWLHLTRAEKLIADDRHDAAATKLWLLARSLELCRVRGIRLMWTPGPGLDASSGFADLDRRCRALLVEHADAVVVQSRTAADELACRVSPRDARKLHVAPHGNYAEACPIVSVSHARHKLRVEAESIVFVCPGQLGGTKDVAALLRAFRELRSADARLLLVGTPGCADDRRTIVEAKRQDPRVRFTLGWSTAPGLALHLCAADCVVLPYRKPTSCRALLLAQSFARPVLVPDLPTVRALAGDSAFRYQPGTDAALCDALEGVIAARSDLESMGRDQLALARRRNWSPAARVLAGIIGNA